MESFRLAGPEGLGSGTSYQVMESVLDGPLLRVRVAEFVDLADAYLWQHKQPAAHLVIKLREGIAGLGDAGLAHDLALGRLAPAPRVSGTVAGFTPRQNEAYASCFAPGVRLVWGPPGTGKTRVLSEAISTLLADGRRVLLVSSTNIAVDNALLGVVRQRRHRPGDLLRVGPPHHPDVLKHPDVCLPHLVRSRLAQVEEKRRLLEQAILTIRDREGELAALHQAVEGFDRAGYRSAVDLIAAEDTIAELAQALTTAQEVVGTRQRDAADRLRDLTDASEQAHGMTDSRAVYERIDQMLGELGDQVAAADALSGQALTAWHEADLAQAQLDSLAEGSFFARIRSGASSRQHQHVADAARVNAEHLAVEAERGQALVERRRTAIQADARRWATTAAHSRTQIAEAGQRVRDAERTHAEASTLLRRAKEELDRAQQALLKAESRPRATAAQREMVRTADAHDLPGLARKTDALRELVSRDKPERTRLEQQHAKVQDQLDHLRRDAEGTLIKRANLVATTLARLRTNKALMDGPYDIVLVDEVGAATLPEVLLAVARASRTAVLLGDFMQLGAIAHPTVAKASRPDVERWLRRDVFEHCGIVTPTQAQAHAGCTALETQHRFGPDIMGLANSVAYGGLLRAGDGMRPHAPDDPEVVFIDVDGLGDIAKIRATGRARGWWPAGALISRVLTDYHRKRSELVGIVTPYSDQVEATLEALRDQEESTAGVTEVGTAHRFQGREFPIVIFDLVEDEYDARWMASATPGGSSWDRDGVRLFNVAVTRTQTRLYLIGSRKRVNVASAGTPLAHVAELLRSGRARAVAASYLITPTGAPTPAGLGPFSQEFAETLARHVRVDDIHDERSFFDVLAEQLTHARHSIWMWAPWTTKRVSSSCPAGCCQGTRRLHDGVCP